MTTEAVNDAFGNANAGEASADAMHAGQTGQASHAGRGGLAVFTAKAFFLATGLVQQALFPLVTSQAAYGALSRVLAISNVLNNVIVSSSTQGVSRVVAAAGDREQQALRATLRVHVAIALFFAALLAIISPFLAYFQHDKQLTAPLVVMSFVLGIYGVYAPLVGYLNGRGAFSRQAALDMMAATLRTLGLIGMGYAFVKYGGAVATRFGTSPAVLGATIGATLAAAGVFTIALGWTKIGRALEGPRPHSVPTARAYLALIVPVMVAQLFTNGLMQADILIVGRYLSLGAENMNLANPSAAANEWLAAYRSAQLFAFLPYQMLFSVTQILFPMLARARVSEGKARVAELVHRGCRIGAIVCGMLVVVVLAMPEALIRFAYGAAMAKQGAPALHYLALGQAAFAMFGLAATVLVSLGRERAAMAMTALVLAVLASACALVIPGAAFGASQLVAAACATTVALGIGLALATYLLRRAVGAFVPARTALRVGACIGAAWAVGFYMPAFPRWLTPLVAVAIVIAYFGALLITGEIGKNDIAMVRSIVARRTHRITH
ncbi:MAG: lipopolysaccharide biosynthesis protein [Polyangiaceae bacterium]|nr:lipopolysaccharide biosynthesis protein [Polyangiaceae bacterium]